MMNRTSPPVPLSLSGDGEFEEETVFAPGVTTSAVVFAEQREAARLARRNPTHGEARAWEALRGRKVHGLKFRREQVINGLRVDFYCASLRLAIEIDGGVHDDPDQRLREELRTREFERFAIRVARIRNENVSIDNLRALISPFLPTFQAAPQPRQPPPLPTFQAAPQPRQPPPLPTGRGGRGVRS
jgi:very-short-patch-repair endonuclease